MNGAMEVMNYDWLKTFPWEKLRNKEYKNPSFSKIAETFVDADNDLSPSEDELLEKKRDLLKQLSI